jgi:hypothetical protein
MLRSHDTTVAPPPLTATVGSKAPRAVLISLEMAGETGWGSGQPPPGERVVDMTCGPKPSRRRLQMTVTDPSWAMSTAGPDP